MGWYTITKVIKGIPYIYRQRSWRDGKRVRTQSVYIGPGGDSGRSTGKLTISTDSDQEARSVPIKTGQKRLGFHGSRDGFEGPPRTSNDGQLGAGFYLSTKDVAEVFRKYTPKSARYVLVGEELPAEFDGDLMEFSLANLNIKVVDDDLAMIDLARQYMELDGDFITPKQIEKLKAALAAEGYHALQVTGGEPGDADTPDPQLIVFPEAVKHLKKIGAELTLHLKTTTRRGEFRTVATMPAALMRSAQEFKSKALLLSAETMQKIRSRHPEVDETAIRDIPNVLRYGEVVRDKWNRALVIFAKRKYKWWRLAIKATRKGEPFVLTYHRSDERHYKNAKRLRDREPS